LIIKERSIPLRLLILQALLRRLPLSHEKYQQILEEVGRRSAGYQGEKALDYYYRLLPQQKYMILHDLNLPDGDYNCQIDTFLLTPEFGLIIDVKNMAGKLTFDTDNEQFIQNNNDKEKGYDYPIAQAERHKKYIQELLRAHHFPPIPIVYLVVISNSYASYTVTGKNSYKVKPRICKADVMLNRIEQVEKMFTEPILNKKVLRKLGRLLLKMNTPPTIQILKKYGIQKSDLLTGVHCPFCKHLHLIRKKQQWYCTSCDSYSKDAHIQALMDYFLLVDLKITNQQFREFVRLNNSNRHLAKRLLSSANLDSIGTNKARVYFPKKFPS
jgi:transposase-like protein